jgi:hypothetical protein
MNANVAEMNNSLLKLEEEQYMAGAVAWNDGARGKSAGSLSSLGKNITDARIEAEDGGFCPFVRPHNYDEKLAIVKAKHICMVERDGTSRTVQEVLQTLGERSKYMGYTSVDPKVKKEEKVVFRVQTAWVPLAKDQSSRKIAPTHYSYQTRDPKNPRNLLVVGSAQGICVHSDGVGQKKLLAHTVDKDVVNTHYFEAEPSDTLVGRAAYDETLPSSSKKAKAVEMGVEGMGPRANCFVVVSVPLTQKKTSRTSWADAVEADDSVPIYRSLAGTSFAARVSVSEDVHGTADKVAIDAVRDTTEPIVVTLLLYNTVQTTDADVSSQRIKTADIGAAVQDMEAIYDLATKHGGAVCKLSELPAMLHKLEAKHVDEIRAKVQADPPVDPMVPRKDALAAVA